MIPKVASYLRKGYNLAHLYIKPYRFGFVRGHSYLSDHQAHELGNLLQPGKHQEIIDEYEKRLSLLIGSGYGVSFAAGRMAFYTILKALNVGPGDEVIMPGFTCSVMPNAIRRIGATTVFSDIDPDTFGSDASEIEKKITSRTKVIVAQHSFGIPCRIDKIVDLAKRRGLFLIEDCAISLDSSFRGTSVGNWGDAAIFSTDHSKPLNTIIGGFAFTRDEKIYKKIYHYAKDIEHLTNNHQVRLYKRFLFEREYDKPNNYTKGVLIDILRAKKRQLGLDRSGHVFLEADYTRNLSTTEDYPYPANLPYFLAQIGLYELDRWKMEKERRKGILEKYLSISTKVSLKKYLPKAYRDAAFDIAPLRFVFRHPRKESIVQRMSEYIDTGWFWFQNPVICCPYGPADLGYINGSCEKAELAGKYIINWPCMISEEWESLILSHFDKTMSDFSPYCEEDMYEKV